MHLPQIIAGFVCLARYYFESRITFLLLFTTHTEFPFRNPFDGQAVCPRTVKSLHPLRVEWQLSSHRKPVDLRIRTIDEKEIRDIFTGFPATMD